MCFSLASDEHPLASTAQVGVQAGLPEAGAEGNKFSYNPLTDWSHKVMQQPHCT